jgi:hypothetical protein
VGSTTSSDLGEDPDMSMLMIIDLKQHNSELQDQIHVLQQHVSDLEEQVNVSHLHNASLANLCQQDNEWIAHLERQIQRFSADRSTSTSTPVWNITARQTHSTLLSTSLRYQLAAPSHTEPLKPTMLHHKPCLPLLLYINQQLHLTQSPFKPTTLHHQLQMHLPDATSIHLWVHLLFCATITWELRLLLALHRHLLQHWHLLPKLLTHLHP